MRQNIIVRITIACLFPFFFHDVKGQTLSVKEFTHAIKNYIDASFFNDQSAQSIRTADSTKCYLVELAVTCKKGAVDSIFPVNTIDKRIEPLLQECIEYLKSQHYTIKSTDGVLLYKFFIYHDYFNSGLEPIIDNYSIQLSRKDLLNISMMENRTDVCLLQSIILRIASFSRVVKANSM